MSIFYAILPCNLAKILLILANFLLQPQLFAKDKLITGDEFIQRLNVDTPTQQSSAEGDSHVTSEVAMAIHFRPKTAELADEFSQQQLQAVGAALASKELLGYRFEIGGHTDNTGSDADNWQLSQQRAEAVRNILCQISGVDCTNLEDVGYGEANPIASNATKAGRAQNRRISIKRLDVVMPNLDIVTPTNSQQAYPLINPPSQQPVIETSNNESEMSLRVIVFVVFSLILLIFISYHIVLTIYGTFLVWALTGGKVTSLLSPSQKRKNLIFSIIIPLLFIGCISFIFPNHTPLPSIISTILIIAIISTWIGPAFFAARYAKSLGMPGGFWGVMSLFFPIIFPIILAAISRHPLPTLTPDTIIAGKCVREWGLGDPIKMYNTRTFFGISDHMLVVTTQGLILDFYNRGIAWDQVKEIYQDLRDGYVNGIQNLLIRQYDLVLQDGMSIRIDQRYNDIDELGPHLQRQVTMALLKKQENLLEQGEKLTFSKQIAISSSSLFFNGKELSWNNVAGIGVNVGYLVINKKSGRQASYAVHRSMETAIGILSRIMGTAQPMTGDWQGIQWGKIPANTISNIYLLITLADVLMKKSGMLGNARIEALKRIPESQTVSTSPAIPAAVESISSNYEEFHRLYIPHNKLIAPESKQAQIVNLMEASKIAPIMDVYVDEFKAESQLSLVNILGSIDRKKSGQVLDLMKDAASALNLFNDSYSLDLLFYVNRSTHARISNNVNALARTTWSQTASTSPFTTDVVKSVESIEAESTDIDSASVMSDVLVSSVDMLTNHSAHVEATKTNLLRVTHELLSIELIDSNDLGNPGPGGDAFQKAIQSANQQDDNGAIRFFEQALELGLDTLRQGYAHSRLGERKLKQGNFADGVEHLFRVLTLKQAIYDSVHTAAQYLNVILLELGRTQEAQDLQTLVNKTQAKLGYSLSAKIAEEIRQLVKRSQSNLPIEALKRIPVSQAASIPTARDLEAKTTTGEVVCNTGEVRLMVDYEMLNILKELCYEYSQNGEYKRLEPIATRIGEELNQRGGIGEMRRIFALLNECKGSRTLEMHWGGIGDWQGSMPFS